MPGAVTTGAGVVVAGEGVVVTFAPGLAVSVPFCSMAGVMVVDCEVVLAGAAFPGGELSGAPTAMSQRWPGCPCGGFMPFAVVTVAGVVVYDCAAACGLAVMTDPVAGLATCWTCCGAAAAVAAVSVATVVVSTVSSVGGAVAVSSFLQEVKASAASASMVIVFFIGLFL